MYSNNTQNQIINLAVQELSHTAWNQFSLRTFLIKLNLTTGIFINIFTIKIISSLLLEKKFPIQFIKRSLQFCKQLLIQRIPF